jgi:phage shock protein E
MRRLFVALAILMFALTACSTAQSTTLSPTEFNDLTQQAGVVTLDVRTPAEFDSGHLPNAVNIDVESGAFAQQVADLDPNATYAVYCRSGNRSKVAMEQMSQAGVDNTQDLDGGIVAWQSQGLPVVQ